MKMDKEPITLQGITKIKKELDELKSIERPKIISAIAEARAHGDLKENAEYHAAKEIQAKIEGRVIEINDVIARANIIDVTKLENKGTVIFGSTVCLFNLEKKEKKIYKIVGKDEADIKKNYIYFRSPIGKALIGKNKKDLISVSTPSGEKNFDIIEVKYI
jgi:transcription elongation factor GreA|tara:strand:+ start:149 stop:631 length:483 start_codon:yes stop_codon:yes gene_type:complete